MYISINIGNKFLNPSYEVMLLDPLLYWPCSDDSKNICHLYVSLMLFEIQSVSVKSVGQLQSAKRLLWRGLRQKWMIPSWCLCKVVIFFGKEHVNLSNISGVMIGLSWKIKFGKTHYLFGENFNLKCQNNPFIGT